jgi:hypothetical protein
MQALAWAGPRARTRFGIAIAPIVAMIATTIIISMRVKALLRGRVIVMMWLDLFLNRQQF